MAFRHFVATVLLAIAVAPLACRDAEGVQADPLAQEAEELLVQYLRINTSNPPGNETEGAKFLQQLLEKEGIPARLVGSNPERQSVYARLQSGSDEKALLLLHHIDVIPAAAAEWTKPPFSGVRSGGYIWGRGALDVKSLGIAELMAFINLKRRNARLRRDVVYLATADEELGGLRGCKELLENNPELFHNVGYVLNEGGYNETAVDKVLFWGIEVQQKVPLWLRLTAKGMGGHGASPPDDGGAVAHLIRALNGVLGIETPYRLTPEIARYLREAGRARPAGEARGQFLRTIREPLDPKQVEDVLPSGYRSLLRDTVVVTRVAAGMIVNAVPATAIAELDVRLLPDSNTSDMLARVKEAVGKEAEVEVLLAGERTPPSPSDTDLFRVLSRAMVEDEPGSRVAPIIGAGTSDSRFFRARGITAYGIAPFKVNYYDADSVHSTDERIRSRFFAEGVRLVRRIVDDFCTQS